MHYVPVCELNVYFLLWMPVMLQWDTVHRDLKRWRGVLQPVRHGASELPLRAQTPPFYIYMFFSEATISAIY